MKRQCKQKTKSKRGPTTNCLNNSPPEGGTCHVRITKEKKKIIIESPDKSGCERYENYFHRSILCFIQKIPVNHYSQVKNFVYPNF